MKSESSPPPAVTSVAAKLSSAAGLVLVFLLPSIASGRLTPGSVYTLHSGIVSSAVFPSLQRFYVLTDVSGEHPAIEMRRLSDGALLRVVNACNTPQQLAALPKLQRLYVTCGFRTADDDDPTLIAVIDARSGVVQHYSMVNDDVVLRVDGSSDLPFLYAFGDHPVRIDARTGKVLATLRNIGRVFAVRRGRLFSLEDAGRSIAVFDARTGEPEVRYSVGSARDPSDVDIASSRHRAYVTFSAAGALGIYNGQSGSFLRTVPAGEYPAAVYADAARDRVLSVSGGGLADRTILRISQADGNEPRELVLDSDGHWGSHDNTQPDAQIARDEHTGRYVVADSESISVIAKDASHRIFSLQIPASGRLVQLDLDSKSGEAYGFWASGANGFFMRLNVRQGGPQAIKRGGAAITVGRSDPPTNDIMAPMDPPRLPAYQAPPGLRSPVWLAAGRNGLLAVSLYGERSIGFLKDGKYRQQHLPIRGLPASITVDRADAVWFSEYTTGNDIVIGRLDANGTVREFELHGAASSAAARSPQAPRRPLSLVTGNDRFVWGFDAGRELVVRVDGRGNMQPFELPTHDHINWEARSKITPRAAGGVYVADGSLWSVAADGTTEPVTPSLALGQVDAVVAVASSVRFIASDLIATVAPSGGLTGVPIDQFTIRVTKSDRSTSTSTACVPSGLVVGKDGANLVSCGNAIIRVDEKGFTRSFPMPTPQSDPMSLTVVSDGSVWFVEPTHSKIGVLRPDGSTEEYGI
jgi:hypothetical protein